MAVPLSEEIIVALEAIPRMTDREITDQVLGPSEAGAFRVVAVRDQIGIPESDYQYRLVLQAHLMQLARRGRVGAVDQTGSMRWTVAA